MLGGCRSGFCCLEAGANRFPLVLAAAVCDIPAVVVVPALAAFLPAEILAASAL